MKASQIVMWVDIYAIIVMSVTMIEDIRQYFRSRRVSKVFIQLEASIILMLVANVVHFIIENNSSGPGGNNRFLLETTDAILFIFYYGALFSFVCYIREIVAHKRWVSRFYPRLAGGICLFCSALWVILPFVDRFFSTYGDGRVRGPILGLGHMGGYLIGVLTVVMIARFHRALSTHSILVLLSFILIPMITAGLRPLLHTPGLVQLSMSLGMVILHVSIFHERAETLRNQEILLTRARIRIMRSQIGPHFLFNTLNAIYVLCEKDPEQAQQAVSDFSEYLRANLDSLENDARIPFVREMDHVDRYLSLEKMRFRDDLRIEQKLEATGFLLPVLTIQPIVENAVNHGIGHKRGGGTVTIRSEEREDCFVVTVSDDGVGFDPGRLEQEEPEETPKEKHHPIGLKNVRERLAYMSDGTMTVTSSPGVGTTVELRLPKDKNTMFG